MGILNCTPDSFFPASRSATIKEAMKTAREMIDAGVDIIDVGGESTRPGSEPVSEEEEIRRVIPVIQALRAESDVIVSVDTRKKEVAERALDAGADIVNDISGLRHDEELARLVARRKVPDRAHAHARHAQDHAEEPLLPEHDQRDPARAAAVHRGGHRRRASPRR